MEGQSVVLRAEKGKLRLMVDDEEGGGKQEMVYEVTAKEERGIVLLKRLKGRRPMEKTEKPKVERPGIEEKKGRKVSGHTAERSAGRCSRCGRRNANPGRFAGSWGLRGVY